MVDVRATADAVDEEIVSYWDERSTSYSNGVLGELSDRRSEMWRCALAGHAPGFLEPPTGDGASRRVLDIGCGPGFFTILFSESGCQVDAVDSSAEMLARARENVRAAVPAASPSFHKCDFTSLPFADGTFDLVVGRNVTWLMRLPETAYAEWLRVLRPGGKLLMFDANWYRYLIDEPTARRRAADMAGNVLEGWDEDAQATSDEEKHCEEIAAGLPMTYILRPGWDLSVLSALGAASAVADEGIWREVWSENEQSYYAATPMFLIEAVK